MKETNQGQHDRTLARRGRGLFTRVSFDAAADTFEQAALIAEYCQRHGIDPQAMSRALLADETAIAKIADAANNTHRIHHAEVEPITPFAAREQIEDSFNFAGGLLKLPKLREHHLARVRRIHTAK